MPTSAPTVVCVPVTADRQVGHSWGKAPRVAVVTVADGRVLDWADHDVAWDVAHDLGEHGSHHARVVRFLREHGVQVVVAGHMGPPMQHTLGKLGVAVHLGATGDAAAAVAAAAG